MRSRTLALAATAALLAAAPAARAAQHNVTVQNFSYTPEQLQIAVGDTVVWTNQGGTHSVTADDGSFGRPASGAAWTYSHTFDSAGTFLYYCTIHGAPNGVGMSGRIVVSGGGGGTPGSLRFSTNSLAVPEGATATVVVQRVGGDDGAVGVHYATSGGSASAGSDYTARSGNLSWADNDDSPKSFTVPTADDAVVEPNETVVLSLSAPTGGASLGSPSSATLTLHDNDSGGGSPGTLSFAAAEVSAAEDSGAANLQVRRTGGSQGAVSATVASDDGSATGGEDYTPVSTVVHFAAGDAAAKNVAVPLLDDNELEGDETINLALSAPTGGATLGSPSAATVRVLDDDVPAGPCVPDETTLCLGGGRFRVQVTFRPPNGTEQLAHRIELSDDSGLFWFFQPSNVEMLIKVLDACVDPFNHYWVFFAATTNVEFTVTVVDTQAVKARRYPNPQGKAALPVQDTSAFATCP